MNSKLLPFLLVATALATSTASRGWAASDDISTRPVDTRSSAPAGTPVRQSGAMAYTVSFAYKEDLPPPDPQFPRRRNGRIAEISITRLGDVRHDVRVWEPGGAGQKEAWWISNVFFEYGTDIVGNPNGIHSDPAPAPIAFPEMSWVSASNFIGTIKAGNRMIDVYRLVIPGILGGIEPFLYGGEEVSAYVDEATRLPAVFKTTHYTAVYTFGETPTQLPVAPDFKQASQIYQEKAANPPPPP